MYYRNLFAILIVATFIASYQTGLTQPNNSNNLTTVTLAVSGMT